ncbi:MAG: class I SAM-dependent methyltransferase, partial [Spongiibacteraceae bacterium]
MLWNSDLYKDKHAFVFKYGEDVLQWLAPQPGERILDVGCGTGDLTQLIANTGAKPVGIDNSAEMIASAAARFPGVEFKVADAADFYFDEQFDAIFSNAALHWVRDAEGAVICMSRVLKPG